MTVIVVTQNQNDFLMNYFEEFRFKMTIQPIRSIISIHFLHVFKVVFEIVCITGVIT